MNQRPQTVIDAHEQLMDLASTLTYEHLPPNLQAISKPFCELARDLVANADPDGPVHKLWELQQAVLLLRRAKDHAVIAGLA